MPAVVVEQVHVASGAGLIQLMVIEMENVMVGRSLDLWKAVASCGCQEGFQGHYL